MKRLTYNILEIVLLALLVSAITTYYTYVRANYLEEQNTEINKSIVEIHRILELPMEVEYID